MIRMTRATGIVLASLLLLLFCCPAFAEPGEFHSDCKADVKQFCKGVQPGQGKIIACLESHKLELSSACREKIGKAENKVKVYRDSCMEDVQKYCAGVKPGEGRIMACLAGRERDLSPACKEQIGAGKRKVEDWNTACEGDMQKYCVGTKPGKGRIPSCLAGHKRDLSPACKNFLGKAREK
jgi:hypothetical protein